MSSHRTIPTPASEGAAAAGAAELWLAVLESLARRVAHEIRNRLNGAAVNLEVVRGRLSRPVVDAAAVAPFANVAAGELERLVPPLEALFALLRPGTSPVDVLDELSRFVILLGGRAADSGWRCEVGAVPPGSTSTTSAAGVYVHLALGSALVAALLVERPIRCRTETLAGTTVYIETEEGEPIALDARVASTLQQGGVAVRPTSRGIAFSFPPAV